MEDAVIVLIIFGSMFAVIYVFLTTRNKERLALIEKGADAKLFKTGGGNGWSGSPVLTLALLAIGIGVGVFLGSLLSVKTPMDHEIAMTSMIFICGGIGLLAGFLSSKKLMAKKED